MEVRSVHVVVKTSLIPFKFGLVSVITFTLILCSSSATLTITEDICQIFLYITVRLGNSSDFPSVHHTLETPMSRKPPSTAHGSYRSYLHIRSFTVTNGVSRRKLRRSAFRVHEASFGVFLMYYELDIQRMPCHAIIFPQIDVLQSLQEVSKREMKDSPKSKPRIFNV